MEEDDWLLLTKDAPARCSRWSQACRLLSLLVSGALQTKQEMVARWLVDISPLFLVLVLEGKDGF